MQNKLIFYCSKMIETKMHYKEKTWTCFICNTQYRNTLLYCPICKIARLHSNNLFDTADSKNKEQVVKKRHENFREKKRRH